MLKNLIFYSFKQGMLKNGGKLAGKHVYSTIKTTKPLAFIWPKWMQKFNLLYALNRICSFWVFVKF